MECIGWISGMKLQTQLGLFLPSFICILIFFTSVSIVYSYLTVSTCSIFSVVFPTWFTLNLRRLHVKWNITTMRNCDVSIQNSLLIRISNRNRVYWFTWFDLFFNEFISNSKCHDLMFCALVWMCLIWYLGLTRRGTLIRNRQWEKSIIF